jgi:hypothetical protein
MIAVRYTACPGNPSPISILMVRKRVPRRGRIGRRPPSEGEKTLLPSQELDEVIRYETHLEDQIERKLRQFYARRREAVLRPTEALPTAAEETVAVELVCQAASVAA